MSGSSLPPGSLDGDVNAAVKEYLDYNDMTKTAKAFIEECQEKGRTLTPIRRNKSSHTRVISVQNELVKQFQYGRFKEFFQLWIDSIPSKLRNDDAEARKLEFYLQIYFAIYPLLKQVPGSEAAGALDEGMANFKYYLETRGQNLSQTTEFLSFYALPFIPSPKSHPYFKELFEDDWAPQLQRRLEGFLSSALTTARDMPRLLEMFQVALTGGGLKAIQEEARHQALDSEKKVLAYSRKNQKLQADYHNLIGITADLIDALESTIQGRPVTPEFLQTMCQRLFSNQLRQSISVDFNRPGTASKALRASIASESTAPHEPLEDIFNVQHLDFEKIKYILTEGDDRDRAFLLQALRWKLTRSPPTERDQVLTTFIKHDVLCCEKSSIYKNGFASLFSAADNTVRQYTARLFNAFASLCRGRTYLSQNENLLKALMDNLKADDRDSITRENVLGALQKLSLRRPLQNVMIDEGIVEWLVDVLDDNDSLSDYTLEYSVALMMNLCLRTTGKQQCARQPPKVLKVLGNLLGHENHEIRPYVNGALYSILSIPLIRDHARAMSMEDMLRCFLRDDEPDMNRQLEFIIKQLNSSDNGADVDSDDDEDDEDEEDQDAMEADLDKAEVLRPSPGDLFGDRLLQKKFTLSTEKRSRLAKKYTDEVLHRPITPSHVRPAGLSLLHSHAESPLGSAAASQSSSNGRMDTPEKRSLTPISEDSNRRAVVSPSGSRGSNGAPADHQDAFKSRPRINRTPDVRSPGGSMPPAPKYSDSLPSPRPGSTASRSINVLQISSGSSKGASPGSKGAR